MIKFKQTTFEYNQSILLSEFNLDINKGEKVVLYGASGSGKSTLLHALLGFVHPQSGTIEINGAPLTEESVALLRKEIAWLPQEFSMPLETVQQAMLAPFEFKANADKKPQKATMVKHLLELGLEKETLEKRLVELSGGQRQRIMLATALLLQKPILLLDEPTSALDAASIELMIRYLKNQNEVTMLAVSHDAGFINAFDRKIEVTKPIKNVTEL